MLLEILMLLEIPILRNPIYIYIYMYKDAYFLMFDIDNDDLDIYIYVYIYTFVWQIIVFDMFCQRLQHRWWLGDIAKSQNQLQLGMQLRVGTHNVEWVWFMTLPIMWVKQWNKPLMTGNGNHAPINMVMTGEWFIIVLPTLHKMILQTHLNTQNFVHTWFCERERGSGEKNKGLSLNV